MYVVENVLFVPHFITINKITRSNIQLADWLEINIVAAKKLNNVDNITIYN